MDDDEKTNGSRGESSGDIEEIRDIVIIGAGIIGCATAYYLSHSGQTNPSTVHLVESSDELFASASGKSGGFLASDWFGSPSASLGALSFQLHKQLASENDGKRRWGYSRSTATSLREGFQQKAFRKNNRQSVDQGLSDTHDTGGTSNERIGPSWLRHSDNDEAELLSDEGTVAQVDPKRLSQFLLDASLHEGVRLHQPARPLKAINNPKGSLRAVRIQCADGTKLDIPCSRILIAAGAWTSEVFELMFPESPTKIPVSQLAGYSLVVKSPRWKTEHEVDGCHAVFTSMLKGISPEIFSRVREEIYIAGLNDSSLPLPTTATEARTDPNQVALLKSLAQTLLGSSDPGQSDLEILREGLCFRPVTADGHPILTRVPGGNPGGVFVASGHGPWGISHNLGTGKVMAEMIEDQDLSADIRLLGLRM